MLDLLTLSVGVGFIGRNLVDYLVTNDFTSKVCIPIINKPFPKSPHCVRPVANKCISPKDPFAGGHRSPRFFLRAF